SELEETSGAGLQ
ncbi:hypothetical protein S40285_09392, partial [Stachybotrys chlorohalonatus IBT 40285]